MAPRPTVPKRDFQWHQDQQFIIFHYVSYLQLWRDSRLQTWFMAPWTRRSDVTAIPTEIPIIAQWVDTQIYKIETKVRKCHKPITQVIHIHRHIYTATTQERVTPQHETNIGTKPARTAGHSKAAKPLNRTQFDTDTKYMWHANVNILIFESVNIFKVISSD